MITNQRQYRITKAQLNALRGALRTFDLREAAKRTGSQALARAEYDALDSQVEELAEQVSEYEALRWGTVAILKARSLEELPTILIKARIAKRLSQRRLAEILGLREQQVQRYEAENYASASLRRLAEVASALDLGISEIAEFSPVSSAPETGENDQSLDWSRFPLDQMYRRNWFKGLFSGSLAAARANSEELVSKFVHGLLRRPVPALFRGHVRSGSVLDRYSLLAWQCRVLALAKEQQPLGRDFSIRSPDDTWLRKLVRNSRHEDGPRRAKAQLEAAGIHLVVEPHLEHTYLDGAALLMPRGAPVVGLTLRYDRLDNFWFVLTHEVVHVIRHLRKGKTEGFFDDLDGEPDEVEREADRLAGEALIPEHIWDTALARYVREQEPIRELAEKLEISPTIVAGRIRNEANDYTILTDLIGQGEVRKQFPEVRFGQ